MKRNISRTTIAMIFFAMLCVGLAPAVHAQVCSLALTAGKYGVSDSGTVVGVGPRAATALLTLDAEGNVTGRVTANVNGSVTHTTVSGTYTVNPDCTGTSRFGEFDQFGNLILTVTADIVWDDDMREFRFVFTSATLSNGTPLATVINGNAKKTFAENSNQ